MAEKIMASSRLLFSLEFCLHQQSWGGPLIMVWLFHRKTVAILWIDLIQLEVGVKEIKLGMKQG